MPLLGELYVAAGGPPPLEGALFFLDLWTKTRNSIACVAAGKLFDTRMPRETKFAMAGHIFAPYLRIEECEAVVAQSKKAGARP